MRVDALGKQVGHAREFLASGFVLLVLVVALTAWFAARERQDAMVTQTILLNKDRLSNVLSSARQAESGQRGYLLTGDPLYLKPYRDATETALPRDMQALRQAFPRSPEAGQFQQIEGLLAVKLGELARTISLYQSGQQAASLAIVKTGVGMTAMAQLRGLVGTIEAEQTAALKRNEEIAARNGWMLQVATLGTVLAAVLLAWFAIRENRLQNAQIAAAEAELRAANADLERKVAERTRTLQASEAALAEANTSLEARVAERSRELDRIFKLSNDILAVSDFNARLVNVSPAWTQITGWPTSEALSRPFQDFVHPDDHAMLRATLTRLRHGAALVSVECRVRRPDGGWSWLAWRAVPLPTDELIYAIGRDVTLEKAREEQLRQSQKMEIVGQLTGGIAHDFNNLLTVIMGSLEMLQRDLKAEPKAARRLDAAMGGAQRAAALTHRLLAFSRRQPLAPQPLDANRLIAGMSDMLHRTLGETIAVEQLTAPALWPALADANQLENAILNLVVNARDAMPDGGRITITTGNAHLDERNAREHTEMQAGDYVTIGITDTGTGMSDAVKAKVFEPFFTTKPQGQGTGLGLAQVYGFIRQSGGHVVIESKTGLGTTVQLYLPRLLAEQDNVKPEAARQAPAGLRPAAGETILLVEDEEGVRAFSAEILEELGYRVLRAEDAAAAMAIFEVTPAIDMLFTDVVLTGGTNGRQLADTILARRPDIIVLFTTGYTRNAIIHQGRLDEGINFIGKPFTADELGRKVGELFEAGAPRVARAGD